MYGDGSAPTSQVITGLWDNASTLTWTDAQTPLPAGFQEENLAGVDGTKAGTKDVSDDSPAIEWYDIDFAALRLHARARRAPSRTWSAPR